MKLSFRPDRRFLSRRENRDVPVSAEVGIGVSGDSDLQLIARYIGTLRETNREKGTCKSRNVVRGVLR